MRPVGAVHRFRWETHARGLVRLGELHADLDRIEGVTGELVLLWLLADSPDESLSETGRSTGDQVGGKGDLLLGVLGHCD